MPYIKKLKLHGFKSFAKPTEIIFDKGLNTIIGPNGSGKSNLSDAICFVLGRLSIKSIRATKAANLIYNGGKNNKPADEARVDLVIDNTDRTFVAEDEVIISRIVKRDGQSIYKIDGKTKTRQEVLDLLAQGGIDPYGFNIILQGEISTFVQMHSEERRKIIEEVAGISIYESRKEKSLKELEKTEERLREINAILNERAAYLKNLDKERTEALRYRELESAIKSYKASLLVKSKKEKEAEREKLNRKVEEKKQIIDKLTKKISELKAELENLNTEIESINSQIQESTGMTQETIHKEISEKRAEIAALSVRVENYRQQLYELNERTKQLESNIKKEKINIQEIKDKIAEHEKISELLKQKSKAFESIEKRYEHIYKLKTSLTEYRTKIELMKNRESQLLKQIVSLREKLETLKNKIQHSEEDIKRIETIAEDINKLKIELEEKEKEHIRFLEEIQKHRKEIEIIERLREQVNKMDICPTCGRKVTQKDKENINKKAEQEISKFKKKLETHETKIRKIKEKIEHIRNTIETLRQEHQALHISKITLSQLTETENNMKEVEKERENLLNEISRFEKKERELEIEIKRYEKIEKTYNEAKKELERLEEEDKTFSNMLLDLRMKEQDIARMQSIIKKSVKEREELKDNIERIERELREKEEILREKEKQDRQLRIKFNTLFIKRNKLQQKKGYIELEIANKQNDIKRVEDDINISKIALAKIEAELETLITELNEFGNIKTIDLPRKELEERIKRNEEKLARIGSVNMRALQVYDSVKQEYDKIAEKAAKIQEEKNEILKIIGEIDKKKKSVFLKTLKIINNSFTNNFTKLSGKGIAYLELENKENPFSGGLEIIIKIGKGKYIDTSSLSGGEKTLVALSLIFAIQEYKPYCFYILDEVDAALDKRNSERLAELLNNYVKSAQYIIITHNDAVISSATALYGVSMQDGVSKIVSLKL